MSGFCLCKILRKEGRGGRGEGGGPEEGGWTLHLGEERIAIIGSKFFSQAMMWILMMLVQYRVERCEILAMKCVDTFLFPTPEETLCLLCSGFFLDVESLVCSNLIMSVHLS